MTKKRKKSELKLKLEENAILKLEAMVEQAKQALADIATDSSVSVHELARLVTDQKCKTLRRTVCKRLTVRAERELFELYNQQQDLPIKDVA